MLKFTKLDRILMGLSAFVILALLPVLFLPEFVHRSQKTELMGTVKRIENEVRLRPMSSFRWFNLNRWFHEDVHHLDRIYTGFDSEAEIRLLSGDTVFLHPNTLLTFELDTKGEIQLDVQFGEVSAEGPKINPRQTLRPKQKMIIRQSSFEVRSTEPENKPLPVAHEPIPAMSEPEKTETPTVQAPVVPETPIEPADKPKPPEPKLRKYVVSHPVANLQVSPPTAENRWKGQKTILKSNWEPVPEAKHYEVSIFKKTNEIKEPVEKITTTETKIEIEFERNGTFDISVKAIVVSARKPASISTEKSQSEFVVPALSQFPKLAGLFPKNRQLLISAKDDVLFLKWQRFSRVSIYILQISNDAEFKHIEKEFLLSKNELKNKENLPEGVWHWRVKGLSDLGESPWSETMEFRIVYP